MMDAVSQPDERRSVPRKNSGQKGKLVLNGLSVIDCVIVDLTPTGAKIALHHPMLLPETFRVRFTATGEEVVAAKAWQRGLKVGVRFASAPATPPPKKPKKPLGAQ